MFLLSHFVLGRERRKSKVAFLLGVAEVPLDAPRCEPIRRLRIEEVHAFCVDYLVRRLYLSCSVDSRQGSMMVGVDAWCLLVGNLLRGRIDGAVQMFFVFCLSIAGEVRNTSCMGLPSSSHFPSFLKFVRARSGVSSCVSPCFPLHTSLLVKTR